MLCIAPHTFIFEKPLEVTHSFKVNVSMGI